MKYQQDDTLMTLNTEMKTEDGRKNRIHAMHRTASDLCRNVHRRPGLISEQKKSEDDMNQHRPSLLETFSSFGKKKKSKKKSSRKKSMFKSKLQSRLEMSKKQFDARIGRLATLEANRKGLKVRQR